jgi:hypothetical protein
MGVTRRHDFGQDALPPSQKLVLASEMRGASLLSRTASAESSRLRQRYRRYHGSCRNRW